MVRVFKEEVVGPYIKTIGHKTARHAVVEGAVRTVERAKSVSPAASKKPVRRLLDLDGGSDEEFESDVRH